jgi:4-methylaminobutanoate oxidase (formaldehyde-forming)
VVNQVGIRNVINGPIPYSADGDFVMGPSPDFQNLMLATGFLYGIAAGGGAGEMIAEWVVEGRPSIDLWPLDSRRFGPHHGTRAFMYPRAVEHYAHHYKMRYPGQESDVARGLRRSPFYYALKSQGAVYGSKNGWERPLWFAPEGIEPVDQLAFIKPGWQRYSAEEHRAVRERAGLIDQTSFSKFELSGRGALAALQHLAVSNIDKPVGAVIYTQFCNPRGGIEADLTITRLAADRFYIVTGSSFGVHDAAWIRQNLPPDGTATLTETTSSRAVLNLCGPKSREILQSVSEDDLATAAFPFATARQITIGAAPVLAVRIGYVGELGWELHIPTEFGAHVFELLQQAGAPHGLANVGYRAIESLRLEKGYVYWSSDVTPDYTPVEAGLGSRVHLRSEGDFIGRMALEAEKAAGPKRRLSTFTSDDSLPVFGGEPIWSGGGVVSLASSAGYGWTVGKTIFLGYLPADISDTASFEIEAFGERYPLRRATSPLYDPANERLKA